MAEIELKAEEESFVMPAWAGKEVTGDRRYYNSNADPASFYGMESIGG